MIRAFARIEDEHLRRKIVELVEAMEECDGERPRQEPRGTGAIRHG